MEVLFILFAFVSTSVLGLLSLIVLEYQNSRARRWNRLWSERRSDIHPAPIPSPEEPASSPANRPSSTERAVLKRA